MVFRAGWTGVMDVAKQFLRFGCDEKTRLVDLHVHQCI